MQYQTTKQLSLALLFLCLSVAWAQEGASKKPISTKVDVLIVQPTRIAKRIEVVGILEPIKRVKLRVQIPGVVEKLHYGIGQNFNKNKLLAEISTTDLRLNFERAKVNAKYLNTEYNVEARIVKRDLDLKIIQNNLQLAKKSYEVSEKTYARQQQLFEKKLISESQMERAEIQYEQKRIQLAQASIAFEKQTLQRTAKLDGLKNGLDLARNDLKSAENNYKKSLIYTPFKGTVLQQSVEEGEFLGVGSQIYQIADLSRVLVKMQVGEKSIQYLKVNELIMLSVDALENERFESKIWKVGTDATQARSFQVELILDNTKKRFKPGMTARALMPSLTAENQILLPLHAVLENEKGRYVFIENNKLANQRFIKTGEVVGEQVQVLSGLDIGVKVVVRGHTFLANTDPIQIVRTLN